jgi:hypothetical protein
MSRPGPCSPGLSPSVHGETLTQSVEHWFSMGTAGAWLWSWRDPRCRGLGNRPDLLQLQQARIRWSTFCFVNGGTWPPPRHSSAAPGRPPAGGHRHRSPSALRQGSPAEPASSLHIRTGLHRLTGETTKPIERSHIATRDRLRASRGLKTTATGQRFLEGFEEVQALRRGDVAAVSGAWLPTPSAPTMRAPSCAWPWSPWQHG